VTAFTPARDVSGITARAAIVLWPLGGVAYVDPPQRPGATLWSLAAGPLVTLVLFFVLLPWIGFAFESPSARQPDPVAFLGALAFINLVLLVFSLLPVYPLDGGQILRSLLWFVLSRLRGDVRRDPLCRLRPPEPARRVAEGAGNRVASPGLLVYFRRGRNAVT
jgi:Zn-dependent protease